MKKMKFDVLIKRISAFVAASVVFLLAAGTYLAAKGFEMIDGQLILVKNANASENENVPQTINNNIVLPEGKALGDSKAPVSIYEFSSFGCTHCADFHLNTLAKIKKEFVEKGQVKIIFNDFPLDQKSMQASLISHCFDNNKYFAFLDTLFEKQREWGLSLKTADVLKKYAYLAGLSEEDADKCLKDKEKAQEIFEKRQYAAKHLHISGTPSFIVAGAGSREILYGAPNYDYLKNLIEKKLNTK